MLPEVKPLVDIAQVNDDILVQIHADIMADTFIQDSIRVLVDAVKSRLELDQEKAFRKLVSKEEI